MRTPRKIVWAVALALFSAPGWVSFAAAQGEQPQRKQNQGTGVVPPGVKLAPEMPAAAPPKPYHFPPVVQQALANGLRVFVVADRRQPTLSVRLVLTAAGSIHDPAGAPGVAAMTANLLTQGTEKRSAQQIAKAIDFVGGSLSAAADSDGTYVTATVVSKNLPLAMDLLSDVVLHPTFKPEELDRQRQQLLSSLRVDYSDPNYLASAAFSRVVYRPSPYGLPGEGTPDSVAKLTREAMVAFHDAYYVPNHALLAFAGDITPEAALAAAEKYFGAWPRKEVAPAALAAPQPAHGLHIYVVDKPDAVQTQIRVGWLGIPRNSPDYVPLVVTNRIFGGGYNSRLNTEVRIRKGLTYGASSVFRSHRFAGIFAAGTFTRTEETVEATKLVVDLIAKMSTGAVTPAELNFARDYLAGVYPIETETAEQVAGRVLTVAQFGLPADYNDTYQQEILAVDAAQVKAMAERYFNDHDLDLVLVGHASQFRDALKKEFPGAQWEEIPFQQIDLLSADLRRPKEVVSAATPESLERGHAILMAAAEAAGGAALTKVESLETDATGQLFTPQGSYSVEVKIQVAYPDRLLNVLKLPFGTIQQGYDGKVVWHASPQGSEPLPVSLSGEAQRAIDLSSGVGVYRLALSGKLEAHFLGEEEVEGRKAFAVDWNSPSGRVKLYFDPTTHLLIAAQYRSTGEQGTSEVLQVWDDFRPVEGLKIPFHTVTYRDGAKFTEATAQQVKLNPQIDPSAFRLPK